VCVGGGAGGAGGDGAEKGIGRGRARMENGAGLGAAVVGLVAKEDCGWYIPPPLVVVGRLDAGISCVWV
jgi:hypothetical protein